MMGGFCPGGFVQGDFVRGDFVLGGILSRGILSGGFCPGGFCPGGFCPRTVFDVGRVFLSISALGAPGWGFPIFALSARASEK